jgi:hypothetical protein
MILPGLYRVSGMGGGLGIDSIVWGRGGRRIGLESVYGLVRFGYALQMKFLNCQLGP